jgi:hypothetical protein
VHYKDYWGDILHEKEIPLLHQSDFFLERLPFLKTLEAKLKFIDTEGP